MDGRKISFHKFPSDESALRLWVSRVNRKDLPLEKVTKNTVLCSEHFHERRKTQDQPHPVTFAHGNYPLCRKLAARRLTVQPQRCASGSVNVQRKIAAFTDAVVGLFQPKSLKNLCYDAIVEYQSKLVSLANVRRLMSSSDWKFNPAKFAFYTGLPNYEVFDVLMKYLQPQLSSLYIRSRGGPVEHTPSKVGRPRSLSFADEMFLTLLFLR